MEADTVQRWQENDARLNNIELSLEANTAITKELQNTLRPVIDAWLTVQGIVRFLAKIEKVFSWIAGKVRYWAPTVVLLVGLWITLRTEFSNAIEWLKFWKH